jgi:hypothetical protein
MLAAFSVKLNLRKIVLFLLIDRYGCSLNPCFHLRLKHFMGKIRNSVMQKVSCSLFANENERLASCLVNELIIFLAVIVKLLMMKEIGNSLKM